MCHIQGMFVLLDVRPGKASALNKKYKKKPTNLGAYESLASNDKFIKYKSNKPNGAFNWRNYSV